MKGKYIAILIAVAGITFAAGFTVANSLNRKQIALLESEIATLKTEPKRTPEQTLTTNEIRQKIAEADANPGNLEFQKSLGIALYKYATLKQDTTLFDDISRLLVRANSSKQPDLELLATLGNLYLDKGITKADNVSFAESRKYYEKALTLKSNDTDILSNLGSTYLMENPSQTLKAIAEFKRSLAIRENFEPSLNGLIQAYIIEKDVENAEKSLIKLKTANPKSDSISGFESQIATLKTK